MSVKTKKICLVNFFSNFNITFLATWGDFFRMLPNFKMAARGQLQNFLWTQKFQNLESEIMQILHIPHDMEMCK